eukprot:Platyproteum_vivax@DN2793_c0_g1_i1.p1
MGRKKQLKRKSEKLSAVEGKEMESVHKIPATSTAIGVSLESGEVDTSQSSDMTPSAKSTRIEGTTNVGKMLESSVPPVATTANMSVNGRSEGTSMPEKSQMEIVSEKINESGQGNLTVESDQGGGTLTQPDLNNSNIVEKGTAVAGLNEVMQASSVAQKETSKMQTTVTKTANLETVTKTVNLETAKGAIGSDVEVGKVKNKDLKNKNELSQADYTISSVDNLMAQMASQMETVTGVMADIQTSAVTKKENQGWQYHSCRK